MKWQVKLAATARRQISEVLATTLDEFGERKQVEYAELIRSALAEIGADPTGPRSVARIELHPDARALHIGRLGRRARHLFVYRMRADGQIDIGRFLYDGMDLARHLPKSFLRDD